MKVLAASILFFLVGLGAYLLWGGEIPTGPDQAMREAIREWTE